ncbi:MAG: hypothetical protein Q8N00_11365 [Nitrospirota bacterium]|nr:hypothetical protein [Nitrospirota bacterium]MDP3596166.1 hypothetical protein [Nitrospirota bacterium]
MGATWAYHAPIMKRTKHPHSKTSKQPCIKIYTTRELVEAFMARAAEQSRSVSKHGEFLVKQDLATSVRQVA